MDQLIGDILDHLRAEAAGGPALDARALDRLLAERNRAAGGSRRRYVKRAILPAYLRVRDEHPDRWQAWGVDAALEERLFALLRMKPRRTASGVATVTVITKPWPCGGGCAYCPSDVRMPKSYLADEPACQRAERAFFDPYLQMSARLRTLADMGHPVDKVEVIVLGGTWDDYPEPYRRWFVAELFRALNDGVGPRAAAASAERRAWYEARGIPCERDDCARAAADAQRAVAAGDLTYNQAVRVLYGERGERDERDVNADAPVILDGGASAGGLASVANLSPLPCENHGPDQEIRSISPGHGPGEKRRFDTFPGEDRRVEAALPTDPASPRPSTTPAPADALRAAWRAVAAAQAAGWDDVEAAQRANEDAPCRCVGLVVETRPELVSAPSLTALRRLGCTKVQLGVQSLDAAVLAANGRAAGSPEAVARAFALLRLFGFKIHAHFMANLRGATPAADAADYRQLVSDQRFLPDEVKLYPCALVAGTPLAARHAAGEWRPYGEDELVALLADDVRATPPWTRISRMIRDISAHDIVAGNKKANLRQFVDARIAADVRAARLAETEGEGAPAASAAAPAPARLAAAQPPAAGAVAFRGASHPAASDAPLVQEIRAREIAGDDVDEGALELDVVPYETAVSRELFLQWVTPEGRIAGFLRLSLPHPAALASHPGTPAVPGQAMIRELHVYGRTSPLARASAGVQHRGLGRRLVAAARTLAEGAGFRSLAVISAVGTRNYYRALGFQDTGLYQRLDLGTPHPGEGDIR